MLGSETSVNVRSPDEIVASPVHMPVAFEVLVTVVVVTVVVVTVVVVIAAGNKTEKHARMNACRQTDDHWYVFRRRLITGGDEEHSGGSPMRQPRNLTLHKLSTCYYPRATCFYSEPMLGPLARSRT